MPLFIFHSNIAISIRDKIFQSFSCLSVYVRLQLFKEIVSGLSQINDFFFNLNSAFDSNADKVSILAFETRYPMTYHIFIRFGKWPYFKSMIVDFRV